MTETDAEFLELLGTVPCGYWGQADCARLLDIARRGAAMQWMPIEEAPKDGRWILVASPGKEPETACWSESVWLKGWYSGGGRSDSYGPSFKPTHWMPLLTPPERDKP